VGRLAKRAGIDKPISPHSPRHAAITAVLTRGAACATSKTSRGTPTRDRRGGTTAPEAR
jgi:integrase